MAHGMKSSTLNTSFATLVCLLFCSAFQPARSGKPPEQHYDLGGPCKDNLGVGVVESLAAEHAGDWDRLVALQKQSVRDGCAVEYRWEKLAEALIKAGRRHEAVSVVEEMDSRGLELTFPFVKQFIDDPLFKASRPGIRIQHLIHISDARRVRFREILKSIPANRRPPANYIAKGACPFECCQYGNWTVDNDTDLFAAPGSKRVVGNARNGDRVVGLTGEVHLTPEPVIVLTGGDLPKNSIAFVLDYGGEGYWSVYTRGKIVSTFLVYEKYCLHVSDSCGAETLFPEAKRKNPVWWVKVRLPNGVIGWSDRPDNFNGKDGCA